MRLVSQDRMSPPPNCKFQQPINISQGAAKLLVKNSGELLMAHNSSLMTQILYSLYYEICILDLIYIDTKYMDT